MKFHYIPCLQCGVKRNANINKPEYVCQKCAVKNSIATIFKYSTNIVTVEHLTTTTIPDNISLTCNMRCVCDNGVTHYICFKDLSKRNVGEKDQYNCNCKNRAVERSKKTVLKKYGVPSNMQVAAIRQKQKRSCFELRKYTWPSGTITHYQGYDGLLFDYLLTMYTETQIDVTETLSFPFINSNNEYSVYNPKAITPYTVYEAKSVYTFELEIKNFRAQADVILSRGYGFEILVFQQNGKFHRFIYGIDSVEIDYSGN